MILGIIADTHNVLDPRLEKRLAGVDLILHAGDVCRPTLIAELEAIAPVTVVLGNNDDHLGWRETELIERGGYRILMQHIVAPDHLSTTLRSRLRDRAPDLVVFGHTHRPYLQRHDNILFLNPGSAGAARYGLPRSLALLHLTPGGLRAEFLDLDGKPLPI